MASKLTLGNNQRILARKPYAPQPYIPPVYPGVSPADRSQAFLQSLGPLAAGFLAGGAPSTDPGATQKGIAQGILGMGAAAERQMDLAQRWNQQKYMADRQNKADAVKHESDQYNISRRPTQEAAAMAQLGGLRATQAGKEAKNAAINTLTNPNSTTDEINRAQMILAPTAAITAKLKPPKPMFGTGLQGSALAIWTKAQANPKLKNSPAYKAAVGVLSKPQRVPTPRGVVEYPPMMNSSGLMYGPRVSTQPGQPPTQPGQPAIASQIPPRPTPRVISQTTKQKLDLSPAEEAIDLAFGKQYSAQIIGGGQADFDANINKLKSVLSQLETSDNFTGPLIGSLPQGMKEITHPKAAGAQELVEEVVQRNLKIILGAQFTEKEGERLIKRAYNPRLEESQNIERLNRLINSMKKAREAQMAANKYYQKEGTLKGYKGTTVFNLESIERDAGLSPGTPGDKKGWSIVIDDKADPK